MPHTKIHNITSTDHSVTSGNANLILTSNSSSSGLTLVPLVSSRVLSPSGTFSISMSSPMSVFLCSSTSGNMTLQLPTASGESRLLIVKKIDTTSGVVTLSALSPQTIDSSAAFSISAAYQSLTLVSNTSSTWFSI